MRHPEPQAPDKWTADVVITVQPELHFQIIYGRVVVCLEYQAESRRTPRVNDLSVDDQLYRSARSSGRSAEVWSHVHTGRRIEAPPGKFF